LVDLPTVNAAHPFDGRSVPSHRLEFPFVVPVPWLLFRAAVVLVFLIRQVHPRRNNRVRVEAQRVDSLFCEPLRKVWKVGGALATDSDILPLRLGRCYYCLERLFNCGVSLIKVLSYEARVSVQP